MTPPPHCAICGVGITALLLREAASDAGTRSRRASRGAMPTTGAMGASTEAMEGWLS